MLGDSMGLSMPYLIGNGVNVRMWRDWCAHVLAGMHSSTVDWSLASSGEFDLLVSYAKDMVIHDVYVRTCASLRCTAPHLIGRSHRERFIPWNGGS